VQGHCQSTVNLSPAKLIFVKQLTLSFKLAPSCFTRAETNTTNAGVFNLHDACNQVVIEWGLKVQLKAL